MAVDLTSLSRVRDEGYDWCISNTRNFGFECRIWYPDASPAMRYREQRPDSYRGYGPTPAAAIAAAFEKWQQQQATEAATGRRPARRSGRG